MVYGYSSFFMFETMKMTLGLNIVRILNIWMYFVAKSYTVLLCLIKSMLYIFL